MIKRHLASISYRHTDRQAPALIYTPIHLHTRTCTQTYAVHMYTSSHQAIQEVIAFENHIFPYISEV